VFRLILKLNLWKLERIIVLQRCVLMFYQFTSYLYINFLETKVVYLPINTSYVVWVKKKLPWVHNKHNWMSTNLVIFFLTKEIQRDVSKCEILTLVLMKISVFSYVTSYSLAGIYQYCEENYCFNLQTWYLRKVDIFQPQYTTAHSSHGYLLFILVFLVSTAT